MFKLAYTLDVEDWKQFQKDYLKNSKSVKRYFIFFRVVFPIFLIGLYLYLYPFYLYPYVWLVELMNAAPLIVFILIFTFFFAPLKKWQIIRQSIKLLQQGKNKKALNPHELELSSKHLKIKRKDSQSQWQWEALESWHETDHYFYIYLMTYAALIIPKQKIKDKKTLKQAIEFVKSKVKEKTE